jgi:hypothetical protein
MKLKRLVPVLLVLSIACASTPQGKAYQTLGAVVESVYTGMTIYGDQVKAGKVSAADQAKVKNAYEIYQAVIGPAIKSRGLTGSVTDDVKAAADALQKLANDPRYLGARIGALSVLHTWTRAMLFHPHVHMLVTAGGLSSDRTSWIEPRDPRFLVPVEALSIIFRAKICAGLKKAGLLGGVPPLLWKKNWVVHSEHAGRGEKVLEYLARYVYRIAIANSRLESLDNGKVRFRYRDNQTQQIRHVTLPAVEFIGRFLQHVLPRGCTKVRYYGIWSPSCRKQLDRARTLLSSNPDVADSPGHLAALLGHLAEEMRRPAGPGIYQQADRAVRYAPPKSGRTDSGTG